MYPANEHAIGILDSGVGGLTVAKEVMRQLPRETIYYFGDTKRCPYGPRSEQEVRQFTFEIVHFLLQFPLKAILIACNTATAAALEQVRQQLEIPVLGVIEPGARAAIKATKQNSVGVIGTEGTIQSGAYEKTLKRIHPMLNVSSLACPAFVPLVESGQRQTAYARQVIAESLKPFQSKKMDTLILGCTHYPLLAGLIAGVMGKDVAIISSAEETAAELSTILQHQHLLARREKPLHRFFTTGSADSFKKIAQDWLGQAIRVETAELEPVTPAYRVKVF
ncbi:glutamate racemase [Paenactinomyces guangxiensis]|uniref:Glutamate racemase n=1 Tax=Paenactinomyces guangxiensis TaxID=1490290 RepID=A0A7W1WUN0_9BACL|nr:glutamate racemase [Paenactinomyces guangxiensis]MBA4496272.1 glutamate racemase [Paenactinomyces guangxiensis]MBH8593325.1 glutamate racemase [Paenactinomyces guangxiensis]